MHIDQHTNNKKVLIAGTLVIYDHYNLAQGNPRFYSIQLLPKNSNPGDELIHRNLQALPRLIEVILYYIMLERWWQRICILWDGNDTEMYGTE